VRRRAVAAAALAAAAWLPAQAAGDAARGEKVYERCAACHSLAADRTGPRHCGLVGRKAGTVAGFEYSDAMKRSGIKWDARSLDRFIAAPLTVVPGSSMGYDGVKDPRERADLVAWLVQAQRSAECAKPYN
jgi:cytochrome c